MANVAVSQGSGAGEARPPIFEELEKRSEAIRRRAFELFQGRGGELGRDVEDWLAAEREIMGDFSAEIVDKDDRFEIQIAVPGFETEDISVSATPREIAVHAKSQCERKSDEGQVPWREFASADFCRSFGLSHEIAIGKTRAELANGSLKITAPKAVGREPKAAAVKAG